MTKVGVGTTRWCAPEILTPARPPQASPLSSPGQEHEHNEAAGSVVSDRSPNYTEKVDVYSFGVVLWELLTLQMPYEEFEWEAELLERILGGLRYVGGYISVSLVWELTLSTQAYYTRELPIPLAKSH